MGYTTSTGAGFQPSTVLHLDLFEYCPFLALHDGIQRQLFGIYKAYIINETDGRVYSIYSNTSIVCSFNGPKVPMKPKRANREFCYSTREKKIYGRRC